MTTASESSAAWPDRWRVRYPNGDIAPAMNQEQAERVAHNVGGEALPPDCDHRGSQVCEKCGAILVFLP